MRLRRTNTYVKAFDEDNVRKIIAGPTDCVLFDLEDGVPPTQKAEGRRLTAKLVKELDFRGKERVVRINAVDTEYYPLDMEEVVAVAVPDAVRVPKCDTPEDVLKVDADLAAIEDRLGLDRNTIKIWAMVESPIGVMNTYKLGTSCERCEVLTIGMQDLYLSMGIPRKYLNNDLDLLYARQKFVLEGRAAGVQVLDTGLLNSDVEINEDYTIRSKRMGFDGRMVLTVEEAEFANKTYYPTPEQFAWAHEIVDTYDDNEKKGITETYVQGKLICAAVYKEAKELLEVEEQNRG